MLSPAFLDSQALITVSRWLDVDSDECRELDDNQEFTRKILRLGFADPPFLFCDSLGRIWGRGNWNTLYPFHFESGKELIGYRMSKRADN